MGAYERATVGSLPYGLQKRIELVRALMAKPRLLLLDEPAAGLNPAETDALRERITTICRERGITLLVVEHDMHFVGALCARGDRAQFRPQDRRRHARAGARRRAGPRGLSRHGRRGAAVMRLEVNDLHVRYGRVHAVRGVSLTVEDGRGGGGARRQRRWQVVAAQGADGA